MPFNTFLERFAIGIAAASGLLTTACITGMPTAICTALGVGLGAADVRFGSKADMCIGHVHFAPNSDNDCVCLNVSFRSGYWQCNRAAMAQSTVTCSQIGVSIS